MDRRDNSKVCLSPGDFSEEYPEVYLTTKGRFTVYEEDRLILTGRLLSKEGGIATILVYGADERMYMPFGELV
jgi:hypothetical protein